MDKDAYFTVINDDSYLCVTKEDDTYLPVMKDDEVYIQPISDYEYVRKKESVNNRLPLKEKSPRAVNERQVNASQQLLQSYKYNYYTYR